MRIDSKIDSSLLASFGLEATQLLCSGEIEVLALRFGYIFAGNRDTETAIRKDLAFSLGKLGLTSLSRDGRQPKPKVTFFKPNEIHIFATIDCVVRVVNGSKLLVDLVVWAKGEEKHVELEEIHALA